MIRRLLAVLMVALLCAACTGKDAVSQGDGGLYQFKSATKVGETIPEAKRQLAKPFSGRLLGGADYALTSDDGRVVVINFWASWCTPCKDELPGLESVHKASPDIAVIGVNTKDASPSNARDMVEDTGVTFPVLADEPGKTALTLGHLPAGALPFTVVLDKLALTPGGGHLVSEDGHHGKTASGVHS